ncbi:class I SAM-dependent methyltransferase [Leptonema illini]|uniref:Uncharacterized protein n=1 Tax=Leptonema illini DSM 21528 TaxID=929563 RepID=H2CAH1_9LEPT|nr:class I SAM-dependent methyltransferase [Leptonema illini]EHQ07338.1 hypothetical protein Lepil_2665 [Leptonema illini DSM 21528]
MEVQEKRNTPRYPVGDRENILISFTHKGSEHQGSLWDYSRFGLGLCMEASMSLPGRGSQVQDIRIQAYGDSRHLGDGRIARSHKELGSHFVGLMLVEQFIDLDKLLQNRKFHLQDDEIKGIRSLLSDYEKLDTRVREYAADFAAGLAVFKQRLDALDEGIRKESSSMKKSIFQVMENGIGAELWQFMDAKVAYLERIVADRPEEERQSAASYLRSILWPYLEGAPFLRRVIEKPRGYPGDSMMMQMVYEDGYQGNSSFARFLHRHPLRIPSAQAVRNRRGLICAELEAYIAAHPGETVNVLSVACGPAWEMKDFFSSSAYKDRIRIYLLDQDQEALDEARQSIILGGGDPDSPNVRFVKESVRTLLRRDASALFDDVRFDFVYTMGLFDYLTIPVARALVTRLHELSAPGAQLMIGNYTSESPDRHYMDHLMDWPLLYKSPEDMLSLASELPDTTERSIGYEDSGVQMFLKLKK